MAVKSKKEERKFIDAVLYRVKRSRSCLKSKKKCSQAEFLPLPKFQIAVNDFDIGKRYKQLMDHQRQLVFQAWDKIETTEKEIAVLKGKGGLIEVT